MKRTFHPFILLTVLASAVVSLVLFTASGATAEYPHSGTGSAPGIVYQPSIPAPVQPVADSSDQTFPWVLFAAAVLGALAIVDKHLATRPFLVGDRPTIADISLLGYQYYDEETGIDRTRFPNLIAWTKRVAELPGWKHPYELLPPVICREHDDPLMADDEGRDAFGFRFAKNFSICSEVFVAT